MRFFLHLGAGKTGTSAIQATLAQNRAALFAAGLLYPEGDDVSEARAVAGEVNSGNALALTRFAQPARRRDGWTEAEVDDWLRRSVAEADGRDILASSESLQMIGESFLRAIVDKIAALGATVHVIYYVRHLLDLRVSTYAQHVKTGTLDTLRPEERSLDGFIVQSRVPWRSQLQMIAAVVGAERLHCRLYDAERAALVRRFVSIIDPALADVLPEEADARVVNRTPNLAELALLEGLNRLPSLEARRLCRIAVNALLNAPPLVEAPRLHVSPEAFRTFAARVGPAVEAINTEFLPAETPLAITSGAMPLGIAPPPPAADVAFLAAHCIAAAAPTRRRPPVAAPDAPLPAAD